MPPPVITASGSAVLIINGTGIRTYTNRFGVRSTTAFTVAAVGTAASDNLLYLGSAFPVDGKGLGWNFGTSSVQFPGADPTVLTSFITLVNASGVVTEAGSSRVDGLGQAFLSNVPGFLNTTVGASNINSLQVNYGLCQAPITFTNGLRQPTQPSASNGALHFTYSYFISDGLTYSVSANLTITATSAFGTTTDSLGNPYQTIIGITGRRTYTFLSTQATVISQVSGPSPNTTNRFYPYALLSSAPGIYTTDTAPFIDANGLRFSISPSAPINGNAPGTGPQVNAENVRLLTYNNTITQLNEGTFNILPQANLQHQYYTF